MTVKYLALQAEPPDVWHVAPDGNDRWTGRPAKAGRGDGPLATLSGALAAVRAHKSAAGGVLPRPAVIRLRGGRHELSAPVVLKPADSGWRAPSRFDLERDRSLTIEAMPGERPVLSGGRAITGWRPARFNGVRAWAVHLPEVAAGAWTFTQLWVDGRRAPRTRWPRRGTWKIAGLPADKQGPGNRRFCFNAGDVRNWRNLTDVEFVGLVCWTEVRLPLARVDEKTGTAWLSHRTHRALAEGEHGTPYWLENIQELFGRPGEWYLDRPAGMLYYCPRAGDRIGRTEIIAPVLGELLRLEGDAARDRWVEQLVIRGLTFAHTEWRPARERDRADGAQSAAHLPGALRLRGCRQIRFETSTLQHVGTHGIELTDGCRDVTLSRCRLHDLAAGGIKSWHACRRLTVEDCEIYDGGRRHHRACGILIGNSPGNRIVRNHIHGFDYTGVSVGWTWGYAECDSGGNVIEHNHIHDIGRGVLSDLGAIYTLGVQPGTRIRWNHLHDVTHRHYGSYGIYLDEGSSCMLVEGNLVYRIKGSSLFLHWGRDNILRDNFFCGGSESVVARADTEQHDAMTIERNVIAGRGVPMHGGDWTQRAGAMDGNLYWDFVRRPVRIGPWTLAEWQAQGMDRHSVAADPQFVDAARDDYRLRAGSPAQRLGIRFPAEALTAGPTPATGPGRPASTGPVTRFYLSPLLPGAGKLTHVRRPPALEELAFVERAFAKSFANIHDELYARKDEDPMVWYACPVETLHAADLDVAFGYDGPVRVWMDDRLVFADPDGTNPCTIGKAVFPVKVAAGRHCLMIAFGSNRGRAWGITLNFIHRGTSGRRRSQSPSASTARGRSQTR